MIRLKGGLGNQLFQYATGLYIAKKQGDSLIIDTSAYNGSDTNPDTKRDYGLSYFNISANVATHEEVKHMRNPHGFISRLYRLFRQKILRKYYIDYHEAYFLTTHRYIDGFFQSEKNFLPIQDSIRKEFTLKDQYESDHFKKVRESIISKKSVSIHIRRGDYVSVEKLARALSVCNREYYEKAMRVMEEKIDSPIFYFFSDDIEWVKNEFGNEKNYVFISDGNLTNYEELMLMSACSHHIIANSTFSWWGAWLNPSKEKIVIAPERWVATRNNPHKHILPDNWLTA